EDSETKLIKETSYVLLKDKQKKRLGTNNEAKMTLYNALPRKEYERVYMCKTTKEVWHTLIITHQGNSQVKNCKIDLLTQEYEKFSISNDETIDSGFIRFNVIMTSLKSLNPEYSSKNHVRKFLRDLPLKERSKVAVIEEAKDLATLPLDELIGNLKVYEMVLDNVGIVSKTTKEKVKYLALKAKVTREQTSDDSDSQEEGNRFKRGNRFSKGHGNSFGNKGGESLRQKGACYNCGVEGHFASECRKPKENKPFIGGAWSDSKDGDEPQNDATLKKLVNDTKVVEPCKKYEVLTKEVDSLKYNVSKLQDEALNFSNFKKSSVVLDVMLSRQKIVCLKYNLLPDDWIVNSGCTKYMIRNRRLFTSYKAYDGGHVILGSNLKGKVASGGNITHDFITITNVEHVSGLAFNLIDIGYSQTSKAYKVLNKETMRNGESLNVTFDESLPEPKSPLSVEDDRINEPIVPYHNRLPSLQVNVSDEGYPKSVKEARGHPIEQVIGELNERTLRNYVKGMEVKQHCCFNEMKD
ncbi:retrovirus-related pol polyprotein from transposon TNT 1-94, partial [Tanacetum coccineum]